MNWREVTGWALAGLSAVCAIAAALVKGGTFEALTAASIAFGSLAGAWGYAGKAPVQPQK